MTRRRSLLVMWDDDHKLANVELKFPVADDKEIAVTIIVQDVESLEILEDSINIKNVDRAWIGLRFFLPDETISVREENRLEVSCSSKESFCRFIAHELQLKREGVITSLTIKVEGRETLVTDGGIMISNNGQNIFLSIQAVRKGPSLPFL